MKSYQLLLSVALLFSFTLLAEASPHRGVWFWRNTTLPDGAGASPYGSDAVVGDSAAEDETVGFFMLYDVKRVYGSYGNRPISESAVIANWNRKLDGCGVSSQILFDEAYVDDPVEVADLLDKITNRLINFNNALGADEAAKFDAVHLDMEPQTQPAWSGASPAVKRALLGDLLAAYVAIRNHLDSAGFTGMPMYADIPFWYDKLPADGGSIGWASASDRDTWFADVADVLEGVSIMTFSKDTWPELDVATAYERSGVWDQRARVAIQPKIGPSYEWTDMADFMGVLHEMEAAIGPNESTDIENYAFWRYSLSIDATTTPPLHRGVWFWNYGTLPDGTVAPLGSIDIVGNASRESTTLTFLKTRGIRRLYGDYGNRPLTEPPVIGNWNAKLRACCISPQLLLKYPNVSDPASVLALTNDVTIRLINFNNTWGPEQEKKFDALHLNLIPSEGPGWATDTPAQRRDRLDDLLNVYLAVRNQLDTAGFTQMPIYADLPDWYDRLPDDGGTIGWADASDRDAWYASVLDVVNGLSIQAFSYTAVPAIEYVTSYERASAIQGKVRVGMQPAIGPGETWASVPAFTAAMEGLESGVSTIAATDIDSFAFWSYAVSPPGTGGWPIEHHLEYISPALGGTGPVIELTAFAGYRYTVLFSNELGKNAQQQEVATVRTVSPLGREVIRVPVQMSGDRGFWRIRREKE